MAAISRQCAAWLAGPAQAGRLSRAQGPPPAPVASGSRPSLGMPPLRPLQLLLVLVLLGLLCCSAEPAGPSSEASEAALLRLLPPRLPLRVVRSAEAAAAALRSDGAFTLLPEPGHAVDAALLAHLDSWLLRQVDRLPRYTVRQPHRRQHVMLRFGDAGGAVATAIGAVLRALGSTLIPADAELAELGAFVVSLGADAQDLHPDRTEGGYLSCQLALHDTPGGAAGGLALWPGSLSASDRSEGAIWEDAGQLLAAARIVPLRVAELPAGAVTCYDGRLWHHGQRHDGNATTQARRVLYLTSTVSRGAGLGMSEGALHPRLRCLPLRNAPSVRLDEVRQNASWFAWHDHCVALEQ